MPDIHALARLHLNQSERVVILLLSYFFYGPLLWKTAARLINNTVETFVEARKQLREEAQQEREQQNQEH